MWKSRINSELRVDISLFQNLSIKNCVVSNWIHTTSNEVCTRQALETIRMLNWGEEIRAFLRIVALYAVGFSPLDAEE
jgi:hypothetical protein